MILTGHHSSPEPATQGEETEEGRGAEEADPGGRRRSADGDNPQKQDRTVPKENG